MSQGRYNNFAHLGAHEKEGVDYTISVVRRPNSTVAVIAPHGGMIERRTGEIARATAGGELNLYVFEGTKASGNYPTLHITSHRFDEPSCIELIAQCDFVVAVHGSRGNDQQVLLGGLDLELKARLAAEIGQAGVEVQTDNHKFPAKNPKNICNRGRSGKGVQLELTAALRGSANEERVIQVVRSVLLRTDAEA